MKKIIYMSSTTLIFFILAMNGLRAEKDKVVKKDNFSEKKLTFFINDFETTGVNQELGKRITSILSRKLTENFPSATIYTKETIGFLKKEYEKQLKEAKNCNAEKCQREISTALSADYTISGKISIASDGKFIIDVMALTKTEDGLDTNNFSVSCYEEQLDYYGDEINKKSMNKLYSVNTAGAPAAGKTTVTVSRIKLAEAPDVMIEVKEFEKKVGENNATLNMLNTSIKEGDELCKQNKYEECDIKQTKNYNLIHDNLKNENLEVLKDLLRSLENKIYNAKNKKFKERIDADTVLLENYDPDRHNPAVLTSIIQKFKGMDENYKKETSGRFSFSRSEEMANAIKERYTAASLLFQKNQFNAGDKAFQSLKFEEAHRIFLQIQNELNTLTQNEEVRKYRTVVTAKIVATQKSGESYLANQVETYMEQAEKYYFQAQVEKGDYKKRWESKAQSAYDVMNKCRTLMLTNAKFVSAGTMNKYNDRVLIVKNNRELPDKYKVETFDLEKEIARIEEERRRVEQKKQQIAAKRIKTAYNVSTAMLYSVFLPGQGMQKLGYKKTGYLFLTGTLAAAFNVIDKHSKESQARDVYKKSFGDYFTIQYIPSYLKSPVGAAFYTDPKILFLVYLPYFKSRQDYSSSVKNYNASALQLTGFYGLNLLITAVLGLKESAAQSETRGFPVAKLGNSNVYLTTNIYPEISYSDSGLVKSGQKLDLQVEYRF